MIFKLYVRRGKINCHEARGGIYKWPLRGQIKLEYVNINKEGKKQNVKILYRSALFEISEFRMHLKFPPSSEMTKHTDYIAI